MACVGIKAESEFRHPCRGLRFGGDAEFHAAAGFFLAPSVPSTSEVDQQPAAAPLGFSPNPGGGTRGG